MTIAFNRDGPRGLPVMLLHGIGGSRAIWRDTVPELATAGFDAIAVDLPGYGDSVALPTGGIDRMAEAVLELMDKLALARVAIVGHSMGGMVAQEIAARWSDRWSALVLACTSPAFGKPGGDWQARFVSERLAPLDAGLGMVGLAAELVPQMVGPTADPAGVTLAQAVMAAVPEATYRKVLAAIVAFDRRAGLPGLSMPTLCLAGELDRTAPPDMMRRMSERIPAAEFTVLEGAGHIANVEQPQAFNAVLIDFLRRVTSLQETAP